MVTQGTGTHYITLTYNNSLQLYIHHPNTCPQHKDNLVPPLCPRDVSLVSISRPQARLELSRLHQSNQTRLQAVAAQSHQGQCYNIVTAPSPTVPGAALTSLASSLSSVVSGGSLQARRQHPVTLSLQPPHEAGPSTGEGVSPLYTGNNAMEAKTKVREDFTITEKAPT